MDTNTTSTPPSTPPSADAAALTEDGLVAASVLPDSALAPPAAELGLPDQATVDRCFGFLDLCGFTRYTSTAGVDAAVASLREFRELVRLVAANRGVRVAKWLGDGCMVVGVTPGPVVATLAECLLRSPGPARGGAAAGPALLFEADDHIGEPVNLASRLCDLASPYELLVSAQVVPFCPPWTVAEPVDDQQVRSLGTVTGLCKVTVRNPGPIAVGRDEW